MNRFVIRGLCLALMAVIGWSLVTSVQINAGPPKPTVKSTHTSPAKKPQVKPPTLSCVESTRIRITLKVCAGTLGLPKGFTIQWQTLEDYVANGGWCAAGDPRLCQATFPKSEGYNLDRDKCILVDIGDSLGDQGATTDCTESLVCGTTYIFRMLCTGILKNKVYTTDTIECSTQDCPADNGGGDNGTTDNGGGDNGGTGCYALSQGYWKNHTDQWPDSIVTAGGMSIGNVFYSLDELLQILNTNGTMGNKLPQLAHQVIAVEFSVAVYGWAPNSGEIQDCLAAAHAAIGDLNILTDTDTDATLSDLTDCLDNGYIQVYDCGT